ncbi:thioesterase [Streptomyces venezuelae]|uniref:Thioesterase n=1 Tax=Streptomyces venezuelae TaxID=54571 RepID=A0A5P2DIT5_STRVZ|nr:thioesterase family protein [Streptomyces venezuelae]QES52889.1 thioesterase [Streptomyces venezuelae]
MQEPPAEVGCTQRVQIHLDDLDFLGMVHNSRHALFVERAVTAFWQEQGWSADPGRSRYRDTHLVVREFLVTYEEPIRGTGDVGVWFRISRLGRTSVTYEFQVRSAEGRRVHAHGHRVQVRIDPETLQPLAFSDELRNTARRLMAASAGR